MKQIKQGIKLLKNVKANEITKTDIKCVSVSEGQCHTVSKFMWYMGLFAAVLASVATRLYNIDKPDFVWSVNN